MIKAFLKDSAIYGIGRFISLCLGFMTLPIITTTLSPQDYGIFDLLWLALVLLNISVAMEVSQAVARFIAEQKTKSEKQNYVSTAYFFSLFMYALTGCLIGVFYKEIAQIFFGSTRQAGLILYLIPWIILHGTHTFIVNQFRWENKPKEFVILQTVQGALLLAFVFYFLTIKTPTIRGLIHAYLLSSLISAIAGLVFIKVHDILRLTFSKTHLRTMLLFSLPLVPSSLAVFAQNYIDRIMISQMIDFQNLGLYSLAFKIASLLAVFSGIFQLSIVPLIYKHHTDANAAEQFGIAARVYLFFILSCLAGISIFTPEIFALFIGKEFYNAAPLMPILLAALGFQSFYIFAPGLAIVKKTHHLAYINTFGFILNAILNYVFIMYFGLAGAATATMITAIMVCVLNVKISQKYFSINYQYGKIAGAIVLTIICLWFFQTRIPHFDLTVSLIKIVILTGFAAVIGCILLYDVGKEFLKSRKL